MVLITQLWEPKKKQCFFVTTDKNRYYFAGGKIIKGKFP